MDKSKPNRLSGNFGINGFTGIRFVTNYMLALVAIIPILRKDWVNLKLWFVCLISFYCW